MERIGTGHTDPDHRRALTDRQFAAFGYVAVAPALPEAARLAGIGRTTHYRARAVGGIPRMPTTRITAWIGGVP